MDTDQTRTVAESQTTDLERAKLYIEVYKHHWDMYVKGNALFYAVVGALTGYMFRNSASIAERRVLSILLAVGSLTAVVASKYARDWLNNFKSQIHAIEVRLGPERFPTAGVGETLALFGWGSGIIFVAALVLVWYAFTQTVAAVSTPG